MTPLDQYPSPQMWSLMVPKPAAFAAVAIVVMLVTIRRPARGVQTSRSTREALGDAYFLPQITSSL